MQSIRSTPCSRPALLLIMLVVLLSATVAGALQRIADCTLIDAPGNDGDSFRIKAPEDGEHVVRLYFVDCPETTVGTETDARRVRNQTAYFGLPDHAETVAFGRQAAERTRDLLQQPFTIYTRFAAGGGRGAQGRIYAFVRLADGRDLAEILVGEGLARVFGVSRETPEGVHHAEADARLSDLELAAALGRRGAWARSDPERLVTLRAESRAEAARDRNVMDEIRAASPTGAPPDLNSASRDELLLLPGIGPVRAQWIIDHRPYGDFDDLREIDGFGSAIIETLRRHARVEGNE